MGFWSEQLQNIRSMWLPKKPRILRIRGQYSPILERQVDIDVYLPYNYHLKKSKKYPLVIFNDGQDLPRAAYAQTLENLWTKQALPTFVTVGVYANEERIREYGTARQADYKGRGNKALQHKLFIINELIPYLNYRFRLLDTPADRAIAGFSLGGLSAFDIGFDRPDVFGTVGVFSGALWWRWANFQPNDPDAFRIIHDVVEKSNRKMDNQFFWFQAGTLDEPDDRNHNGIIDAIDDTLDLIKLMKSKGCHDSQIRYFEVENGTHDPQTWGEAMPDFLQWTFNHPHGL